MVLKRGSLGNFPGCSVNDLVRREEGGWWIHTELSEQINIKVITWSEAPAWAMTDPLGSIVRDTVWPCMDFSASSSEASKQVAKRTFCDRARMAAWLSTSVVDGVNTAEMPSCKFSQLECSIFLPQTVKLYEHTVHVAPVQRTADHGVVVTWVHLSMLEVSDLAGRKG